MEEVLAVGASEYFLWSACGRDDDVGTGDGGARPHGWYRGNPDGTEAWPQIDRN